MTTEVLPQYSLALNDQERNVLLDVLKEAWKEIQVEEHRTEALRAKDVVHSRLQTIESLLHKASGAKGV